jgi:hypothetical protein
MSSRALGIGQRRFTGEGHTCKVNKIMLLRLLALALGLQLLMLLPGLLAHTEVSPHR